MRNRIEEMLLESIQVKEELLRSNISQIKGIADLMIESLKKNGKVILFGNGGSAADSQHIAAEFVGRFKKIGLPWQRSPLRQTLRSLPPWQTITATKSSLPNRSKRLGRRMILPWAFQPAAKQRTLL